MVEIVEVSLVAPAEETPKHTIWLSNLDLVAPQGHTTVAFFYRNSSGAAKDDFFSSNVLKAALSKTLVPFYPLAGRVVEGEEEGGQRRRRLETRCTGEGARFTVARSDSRLNEFQDHFRPSSEMTKVLTPREENVKRLTVGMMIQVTYFKCGGACLSIAIHRIIADGLAISNILTIWSGFARGLEVAIAKPFIDLTLLKARPIPSISFDHREYSPKPSSAAAKVPLEGTILGLSKYQVDFLKRRCRTKTGAPASTYAAIVAHVWRCACAVRELQPEQETRLFIPVDVRSRLRPPLPREYLGNAVVLTSASAKVRDVLRRPAAFLLEKYREAIDRVDDKYVRSVIDYLEEEEVPDLSAVAMGAWQLESTDLWVVSWLNMKGFYEMDLGWGDPVFLSRTQLLSRGFVYVMKNKEEDGGVMVSMGLEKESMTRFKTKFYEDLINDDDDSCSSRIISSKI